MKNVTGTLNTKFLDIILSNLRPPKERRVGVEIETIFYDNELKRLPVNPSNRFSAQDLMQGLIRLQKNKKNPCVYSLEPGGQLEWASSPFVSLHEISSQWNDHLIQLEKLCDGNKILPIDFAHDPVYLPGEVDLINMKKYHFMNDRFKSSGSHGPSMMRNSTSVQVNIDMVCKSDGENMAFIADCLQPFCSFLFSHVPFIREECVENKNYRLHVWNNTDISRCGHLFDHGIIQNQNLIESFIDYMLGVPAIFIINKESTITEYEGRLGKWLHLWNEKKELIMSKNQSLNERDYGDLVGLNKKETADKYGKEQVHKWRRSYDVSPPGGESLKDVVLRVQPYFDNIIQPEIINKKNILIAAHGNSLRATMIRVGLYQPKEISNIEIPTGSPFVINYENGKLVNSEYLI